MWNPFRRFARERVSTAPAGGFPEEDTSEKGLSEEDDMLPDYSDREDTQRTVTALVRYRKSREKNADALAETAEATKAEAATFTSTLRSIPRFVDPEPAAE